MQKNGFDKRMATLKAADSMNGMRTVSFTMRMAPLTEVPRVICNGGFMACSTVKTVLPLSTRMVIKNGSFVVESTVKVPLLWSMQTVAKNGGLMTCCTGRWPCH